MIIKYLTNDIVLMNIQGTMTTGIIIAIHIVDEDVLYQLDISLNVREDQIIKLLGNAKLIKDEYHAE